MKNKYLIISFSAIMAFVSCRKENTAVIEGPIGPPENDSEFPEYILNHGSKVYSKVVIKGACIGNDGEVVVHGNENDNAVLTPFLIYINPDNEITCPFEASSTWRANPRIVGENEIIWTRDTFTVKTANPTSCELKDGLEGEADWKFPEGSHVNSQRAIETMNGYAFALGAYSKDNLGQLKLHRLNRGKIDKTYTMIGFGFDGLFVMGSNRLAVMCSVGAEHWMYCLDSELKLIEKFTIPGNLFPELMFAGQGFDGKPNNTFFSYTIGDRLKVTKYDERANELWEVSEKVASSNVVVAGPDLDGGFYAGIEEVAGGIKLVHYDKDGRYLDQKTMPVLKKEYDIFLTKIRQVRNVNREIVVVGLNSTSVTKGDQVYPYSNYLFISRIKPF